MERFPDSTNLDDLLGHLKNYRRKNLKLEKRKENILNLMESVNGQVRVNTKNHIDALASVVEWTGRDVKAVISSVVNKKLQEILIKAAEEARIPWVYHPKMIPYRDVDSTLEEGSVSHLIEPLQWYNSKRKNLGFLEEQICTLSKQLLKIEKKKKKKGLNEKIAIEEELRAAKVNRDDILALQASIQTLMEGLPESVVVDSEEEVDVVQAVKIWVGKLIELLIPINLGDSQQDTLINAAKRAKTPWIFYDRLAKKRLSQVRPRNLTIHY